MQQFTLIYPFLVTGMSKSMYVTSVDEAYAHDGVFPITDKSYQHDCTYIHAAAVAHAHVVQPICVHMYYGRRAAGV